MNTAAWSKLEKFQRQRDIIDEFIQIDLIPLFCCLRHAKLTTSS